MKSFNCEVERIDEFIVSVDESLFTEEYMEAFRSVYFDYYTIEEHVEHIANMRARFGRRHIEGYGIPLENGKVPYWAKNPEEVNHHINIVVVAEDHHCEVDITEK
ncbi:hypothetical protein FLK61_34180 [Paenalkalicoccus suaedae]|uniref:Uncharacterized protein n=1 Tax=Paenalkalicoccus suaedae TaxID=2592382 RepID=A0A859FF58_9BACI|nr:hypothetical protein [Paenalkalicoccus suaedae]QKS71675.1 hypothetical protein FLK61_33885 [Paenalkalicoccus suaedae]QKS71727.1 hypothetical protein FLK61_34180 [Paenalkalicoccus suaedae]